MYYYFMWKFDEKFYAYNVKTFIIKTSGEAF